MQQHQQVVIIGLLLSCWTHQYVVGHGRMVEPPSRASMWRYGYHTLADFHDNQAWCGGRMTQWTFNGGKCGVCGDPWDQPEPRDHELGGRYGRGIIVRRYRPGDGVTVVIELTAAHGGYFEFRLCPVTYMYHKDDGKNSTVGRRRSDPTSDCLDRNLLKLRGASSTGGGGGKVAASSTRYLVGRRAGRMHTVDVQLPAHLHCPHCLLQWKYNTGNSWGRDANGTSCLGCGPQEQFYACADVAVANVNNTSSSWTTATHRPSHVAPSTSTPNGHRGTTPTSQTTISRLAGHSTSVPLPAMTAGRRRPQHIQPKSAAGLSRVSNVARTHLLQLQAAQTTQAEIELGGNQYSVSVDSSTRQQLPSNMTELDLVKVWESSKGHHPGGSVYVLPAWYLIADHASHTVHAIEPARYRQLAVSAARRLVDSLLVKHRPVRPTDVDRLGSTSAAASHLRHLSGSARRVNRRHSSSKSVATTPSVSLSQLMV